MEYQYLPTTLPLTTQLPAMPMQIIEQPMEPIQVLPQQIIDPLPTTVIHDPIMPLDIAPMTYPIYQPPMMIPQFVPQPMPILPPQPQPIVIPQPQPVPVIQPQPQPIVIPQPQPVPVMPPQPQPQPIMMPQQPMMMVPQPMMMVPGGQPKLGRPMSAPMFNNSMLIKPAPMVPMQPMQAMQAPKPMPMQPAPQGTRPTLGRPIQPSQSAMFVPVQPVA